MPRPLTITEVGRRLDRDRVTVRRRIKALGIVFEIAMTDAQFNRLKQSFAETPTLPRGKARRQVIRATEVDI